MPTLTLGYSPCPNDTFIFDALVHHKIDTQGLDFEVHLADVETLNQEAFAQKWDITKLSFHAYAYARQHYALLDAGSALGNNCGPLLISQKKYAASEVSKLKIAIPGKYTTAFFLLKLAFPQIKNVFELVFSDIEQAVLDGKVDAGLIIHENRFTYQDKGLQKIIDLGEYWEQAHQMPIPLGGIAIRRNIPLQTALLVNRLLHESVAYAFAHPQASESYVAQHAQEMDEAVRRQHIALYVNDFSLNLGKRGRQAIEKMFGVAADYALIPTANQTLFLEKNIPSYNHL